MDCAYWWEQGTGNQRYIPQTVTFGCYWEKNEPVSIYPSGKKNLFFMWALTRLLKLPELTFFSFIKKTYNLKINNYYIIHRVFYVGMFSLKDWDKWGKATFTGWQIEHYVLMVQKCSKVFTAQGSKLRNRGHFREKMMCDQVLSPLLSSIHTHKTMSPCPWGRNKCIENLDAEKSSIRWMNNKLQEKTN